MCNLRNETQGEKIRKPLTLHTKVIDVNACGLTRVPTCFTNMSVDTLKLDHFNHIVTILCVVMCVYVGFGITGQLI